MLPLFVVDVANIVDLVDLADLADYVSLADHADRVYMGDFQIDYTVGNVLLITVMSICYV
jgi:hypothetical protein